MKAPISIALLLALASPALAQTGPVEVGDRTMIDAFGVDADMIDDLDVLDAQGRKIGEVEEVVGADRDTAESLVVDFEDELAEFGGDDRIVPLDQFSLEGEVLTFTGDAATLADMPLWRD